VQNEAFYQSKDWVDICLLTVYILQFQFQH